MHRHADPWLSTRMAQYAFIRRAEAALQPAVAAAVADYLTAASRAVTAALSARDGAVFANPHSDEEADPPGLPPQAAWYRAIAAHITGPARAIWAGSFGRVTGRDAPADDAGYTAGLPGRLAGFRQQVADRLRRALHIGRARRETPAQLRARVAALMTAENWDGQVMTMTRTETMTALNAGAFHGALTEQERTGQPWTKQWLSTHDQRVRHTHHAADRQARPLHDPFRVGEADLQFPGDPLGPPGEVINCRCAALYHPADQASLTAASAPPQEDTPMTTPTPAAPAAPGPVQVSPTGKWRGPLGFMDTWSADQRMLVAPADTPVRARPLPLPLLVQTTLARGHEGSELGVGVIDRLWVDGTTVMGEGRFDMADPFAANIARKVGLGFIRFVSLDVDDAAAHQVLVDADGNIVQGGNPDDATLAVGDVYTEWRVMGATLLAHPAFPNAQIALADDDGHTVTASAFAEIVGYNPDWGCVTQGEDGTWAPADCQDPDAVPANPTGDGPFDGPEQGGDTPAGDTAMAAPDAPPADADAAGCVAQAEDGTWAPAPCDAPGAVPANPAGDGPASSAQMATAPATAPADDAPTAGPTHAGLAVKAADTGRVLLLQRALDPDDPASGMWEFPGGGIDPGETPQQAALREFAEETGITLPDDAQVQPGWTSPNGVYQAFIAVLPEESELGINPDAEDRTVLNPDDPDGDNIETVAWWSLDHLPDSTSLREEVRDTPWDVLAAAGQAPADQQAAAGMAQGGQDCAPCQAISITAAAADVLAPGWTPPADWFTAPAPGPDGPYSIRVDVETGRVGGYLAPWGVCHVAYQDRCVAAPPSATDYSYFNLRPVRTSDGIVYCGLITMNTSHADSTFNAVRAAAHYDNTGTQAAVVRVGEDQHGIWACGAVLPFVSAEDRLRLSLSSFSGDWRQVRNSVELVAALAVNSPGFPLAAKRTGADGTLFSLTAAGYFPTTQQPPAQTVELTGDALNPALVASMVADELEARAARRARYATATGTLTALRTTSAAYRVGRARARVARVQPPTKEADPDPAPALAKNWVDQHGGLPSYIKRIVKHLQAGGMDQSQAIATAVNVAKKSCATGDTNWPGRQHVNPGSRAEACAAVAQWERMKAAAHAD